MSRSGGLRHPRVVPPLGDARNVSIVVRMSTYFVRKLDADIFLEFWLSRFFGFGHGFCCAHAWNSKNLYGFCSMTAYFCPSHLIKHMHSIRRIAQKCCFTSARALLLSFSPSLLKCLGRVGSGTLAWSPLRRRQKRLNRSKNEYIFCKET